MTLNPQHILDLKAIIRFWMIAIKNSIFYKPDHQINVHSLQQLNSALQKWFQHTDTLDLGFTTDDLYYQGKSLGFDDSQTLELVIYMHSRGILSILMTKHITEAELSELMQVLSLDSDAIREKGGVQSSLASLNHVQIKEVDFSQILESEGDGAAPKMEQIWEHLMLNTGGGTIDLPQSKIDFFTSCFKDTGESSQILNKIYKRAVSKQSDEMMIDSLRSTIYSIISALDNQNLAEDAKNFRIDSLNVISKLPVDMIKKLFSDFNHSGATVNLADIILDDLSEDMLLHFIQSLLASEGSLHSNLLSIFSKLVPGPAESKRLVPSLAENLFQKQLIKPNNLTRLQLSVKELFSMKPDNSFLEEMYTITVDAVINHKLESLRYIPKLQPLVQQFIWSAQENNYLNESVDLILNMLWHEKNPDEFKQLIANLVVQVPALVDHGNLPALANIFSFLTTDISEEHKIDHQIMGYRKGALNSILKQDITAQLISRIDRVSSENLKEFAAIMKGLSPDSVTKLMECYFSTNSNKDRARIKHIFRHLRKPVTQFILKDMERCEPIMVREYFAILNEVAPDYMQNAASSLMSHDSQLKMWEALGYLKPSSTAEFDTLFKMINKEKNEGFRKRIAAALVRSGNLEVIGQLFDYVENNRRGKPLFKDLIVMCGQMKCKQSFPYLRRMLEKSEKKANPLYQEHITLAARSLMQIHRDAGEEIILTFIKESDTSLSQADRRFLKMLLSSEVPND
ncbi:hypothetical protein JXO52_16700 [bacterium]|nr:hypothetical protein [bacterium]